MVGSINVFNPNSPSTRSVLPSVADNGRRSDTTIVCLHGASMRKEVFLPQFALPARVVALDLPGHGDAPETTEATIPGYAGALSAFLDTLGPVVLLGWSLGGHIALELLDHPRVRAAALVATPPLGRSDDPASAYLPGPLLDLASSRTWTEEEAGIYARGLFPTTDPVLARTLAVSAHRAGPVTRSVTEAYVGGAGVDQKTRFESSRKPILLVVGERDPVINPRFFDTVSTRPLWRNACVRLPAGHAPFAEIPADFNPPLAAFVSDLPTPT